MKKYLYLFCVFILMAPLTTMADDLDSLFIDSGDEFEDLVITGIFIDGNSHTKDVVVLREMKSKIGDMYDAALIEEDVKRIRNLSLFSRVEISPEFTEEGVIIWIMVAEQWHIFPYPILYRNERDWSKLSYGAGLLHSNFRGLHNNIMASFWLGYNPGADIYYSNPWFGGDKQYYYRVRVYYTKIKSKAINYNRFDETHFAGYVTMGKKWGYHTYLSMSVGYQQVNMPDDYKTLTYSNSGTDRFPFVGVSFRYDKRDLWEYPKKGYYLDVYATKTTNGDYVDFFRYGGDIRTYIPLYKGISLGMRGFADLSTGSVPVYQKIYLGYTYRVRGEFNTRQEGDNRMMGNVELRFPILPIRYLDLGKAMYDVGGYSQNLPFGISGGIFYDVGTVWSRSQSWQDNEHLQGFGLGLHIHVPYVQLLRLETAWNKDFENQYLLDIGVMF